MTALADRLIRSVLHDDGITRDLGDIEGRMLVDWVVDWAELLNTASRDDRDSETLFRRLFRRAKAINRFVHLWCNRHECGAATQLAASERFDWPLPTDSQVQPVELMEHILNWERRIAPIGELVHP